MMKKIYDITLTITPGMPVWPGDPIVKLARINKIEDGANANVSHIEMSVHTGTHLDSPYHFLNNGISVETLPLDVMIGAVQVIELPDSCGVINSEVLKTAGIQTRLERVLFKTRNSHYWEKNLTEFQTDFVGINEDGAQFLVDRGIRLVGIDYLSISPYKHSRPTHEILLKSNVVILEGANLSGVPAGDYELICLPLKLGGSDGAPARVVLIAE
jgi:arylformamidase